MKTLPRPHPPFPKRLKKSKKRVNIKKFLFMIKELSVNIPLTEALEQMPVYVKFKKDLVTKKQTDSYELADNVHRYSVVATRSSVEKKEDPSAFTMSCTIRSFNFTRNYMI